MFEGVDKRNGIAKTKEENCVEYYTHTNIVKRSSTCKSEKERERER